uniref:GED domain-containing protein n=1 Tax=Pyrodinium bahamense TaxID=73915 RepID=A0A7S0FAC4_9DINO|mmetsp:Transcript_16045/g.44141  ORF Transcript_16045/g.44141 Transcript_16045/m.44141 type:complete len:155 (+) Transcript_16045:323-787(+)
MLLGKRHQRALRHNRESCCALQPECLTEGEKGQLAALVKKAGHNWEELIVLDPRDDAIWCMAAAHAYHKVAFNRFCDAIPRTIDDLLLRDFMRRARNTLMTGLQVLEADTEELRQWFIEESSIAQRRSELVARIKRQKAGLEMLNDVLTRAHAK